MSGIASVHKSFQLHLTAVLSIHAFQTDQFSMYNNNLFISSAHLYVTMIR